MRLILELTQAESHAFSLERRTTQQAATLVGPPTASDADPGTATNAGPPAQALLLALGGPLDAAGFADEPTAYPNAVSAGGPPEWLADILGNESG